LRARLQELGATLAARGRHVQVMEVCGSHTMSIARFGLRDLLPLNVTLISGPGCPVCVTAPGYIDAAIELARRGVIVATFGDMLHVPGSDSSLADCRALFPGSTLEMISVAEESGRLDKELIRIAGTTETTLDRNLKAAVTLAEPLLLFLIAGFIGVIFIGMVIPIFTLQDYIK